MPKQYPFTLFNPAEPLPKVLVKRASKELGEVPSQVSAHLESFRRWLSSMPHLKCRTDDVFLLAFLRHAKFNHSKAQKRLDNFCTFRTSESVGAPSWFNYEEDRLEVFMDFARRKLISVLGFTQDGVVCFLMKGTNCIQYADNPQELYRASQAWNDAFFCDERVQIGGCVYIMDFEGISKREFMKFEDPHASKLSTMYFQEAMPSRIKLLVYLNIPKVFEIFLKAASTWLTEKMKSKLLILQKDLKPAYDRVPGLEELMPSEYKGGNCSFDEICEKNIKEFSAMPKQCLDFGISVDESKRPNTSKNLMRTYKDLPAEIMGTSGTYVKIEDEI
ncbi:hypothetical protein AAHC03_01724 [Spirometra sp. Aus1]|nr:unnamed protein product [Spirometra erinaceieuropaei]